MKVEGGGNPGDQNKATIQAITEAGQRFVYEILNSGNPQAMGLSENPDPPNSKTGFPNTRRCWDLPLVDLRRFRFPSQFHCRGRSCIALPCEIPSGPEVRQNMSADANEKPKK
jgi:hypothetical protein